MKKNYISIALTLSALVLSSSCVDMDTAPMGSTITAGQKELAYQRNPDMVSAGVSGITAMFSVYGNAISTATSISHNDIGYPAIMMILDSRGMDFVGFDTGYNWFRRSLNYSDNLNSSDMTALIWNTIYNQLYATRLISSSIDPETEDPKLQFYLAQALAIRAFDYFTLAQTYQFTYKGNEDKPCVPVITELNADESALVGMARATVKDTYTQIMKDLDKAIALLENSTVKRSDKRYVSREVAYGIRARVNLVMQNYSAAASDAQTAIKDSDAKPSSIKDASMPTFKDITESDWMWGMLVAETDRVVTSGIVNWPSHMGSLNYGYASVGAWRLINKKLYNSIPATDVRKGWFLDANGASANLSFAQQAYVKSAGCPPYTQVKFAPYKNELGTSENANDIPLLRIEEMYLILAEAQAMGGNSSEGKKTLEDFVRAYRDPSYVCPAADAAGVQDEVWNQRRIELWGEGQSYFDVMRLKKPIDRRGGGYAAALVFNIQPTDPVLIYQIPRAEEQANPLINEEDYNPTSSTPSPVADTED
ncbi:MAG: RagB/SusD family nutrient uptake outer membrane protein [Prevotellaceae bacterium]|jgi:hypothetical protein|nr:RagB/SusD family nutrient uptake outer membrane protein [Prevotellaceae bacterium]